MHLYKPALCLMMVLTVLVCDARTQHYEDAKVLAPDGSEDDKFGYPIDLAGDIAVISARGNRVQGIDMGAAYVFRRDQGTGAWNVEARLIPSDGIDDCNFGDTIAAEGDIVVIGADHAKPFGFGSGAAYVFRYDQGTGAWSEEAILTAPYGSSFNHFGCAVTICGGVIAVGADQYYMAGGIQSGAAFVFSQDQVSGSWECDATVYPSDGADYDDFGCSVSLSGDLLVVGAEKDDNDNGDDTGSAYVFRHDPGSGSWIEEAKLLPAGGGEEDEEFGRNVAISGDVIAVGKVQDDDLPRNCCPVHLFRHDSGSGTWVEEVELIASDIEEDDLFGMGPAAISGDIILVGAGADDDSASNAGSVYVFHFDQDSGTWIEEAKLLASDADVGDGFGACAIDGSRAFIGATGDDDNGSRSGSAYAFSLDYPLPDMRVNGENGPLTLSPSDDITLTVALDPRSYDGQPADWWIFVERNAVSTWWAEYRQGLKPKWTKTATPIRFAGATLRTVNGYTVLGPRTLPVGDWIFGFAVDGNKNGQYDASFLDKVMVTVF